jgi:hypothetical protein
MAYFSLMREKVCHYFSTLSVMKIITRVGSAELTGNAGAAARCCALVLTGGLAAR